MHNAIYQNCLALGYLLASEGGIHGKFNLSNFCLQIGDEGNIIEEIIGQMRKITHVQVQTCRGWNPKNLFGWRFSNLRGFKILIGFMLLILGACYIFPCLTPLLTWSVSSLIEAMVERKMVTHVMMLWKCKPLNQVDALWPKGGVQVSKGEMW